MPLLLRFEYLVTTHIDVGSIQKSYCKLQTTQSASQLLHSAICPKMTEKQTGTCPKTVIILRRHISDWHEDVLTGSLDR